MAKVLVTDGIAEAAAEKLRAAGHDVTMKPTLPAEEFLKVVPEFEAILVRSATKVTRDVLDAAGSLKAVGRAGVGVDNIDLDAAKAQGVAVVNAPLAASNAVAELVLGQMLALARHLPRANEGMHAGNWEKKQLKGGELSGKTLALVGVGRIGGRVAELARAFGMHVVAYDPYVTPEKAREMGVDKASGLDEALRAGDFVSVHTPLTPETENLLNAERLGLMKDSACLLNMARGGIVDEDALADALQAGTIAGAALDVFANEPLKESRLQKLPNCLLTPHVGANTREAQDRAGIQCAEQVAKVLAGEKADFRVA